MFIPDPTFFHPGSEFFPSRIHIKEFKYFNPKTCFLRSRKYDPGYSSRIRIPHADPDFLHIPDPVVKKAPDPGPGSATLDFKVCTKQRGFKNKSNKNVLFLTFGSPVDDKDTVLNKHIWASASRPMPPASVFRHRASQSGTVAFRYRTGLPLFR
jgi:hypothetical protein